MSCSIILDLPTVRIRMSGFSDGAMMTLHVVMRRLILVLRLRMSLTRDGCAQTDPTRFVSAAATTGRCGCGACARRPRRLSTAKANVCSVQLSPLSTHLLAFGSANYRVYLYDLRKVSI